MSRHLIAAVVLGAVAVAGAGCAAGRAFSAGETAARAGDWDMAVEHYRAAVKESPDSPEYKIALERAMLAASREHIDQARQAETNGDVSSALREYRKASEYDPSNRQVAAKAFELERTIREQIEAARPRPPIEQLRERARRAAEPYLNPASKEPLALNFTNVAVKEILNFIGSAGGINVTYDSNFQEPKPYSLKVDGVTLEQALQQIMTANSLFYKVLNERSIIVANDNPQNHVKYDEMVIRTFYVSHADVAELMQLVTQVTASQAAGQTRPILASSKLANTITARGTAAQVAIVERIIEANDKPRAEIVLDVEILEVDRSRAKQYGLNLSEYAIGIAFSPEQPPGESTSSSSGLPPFNLNTITRGVSPADFYLSVPSAIVRFLESDSETRVIAKPNLRGQEGETLKLNLGDEIPVLNTQYVPFVTGGVATSPFTSYTYRPIGLNLELKPRVTYEGDIILEVMIENSALGQDITVGGMTVPSFISRKVTTKLRLHDGESNLLAGLLREDERRTTKGVIGTTKVPVLRDLFASNDRQIQQSDIVMLLTPRIIRTQGVTVQDLTPIYIGTQQNPALGGPPPLIAPPAESAEPPAVVKPGVAGAAPVPGAPPAAQGVPAVPPGASPVPGTVVVPPAKPGEAAAPPATPPVAQPPTPPAQQPPAAPPAVTPPVTEPPAAAQAPVARVLVTPPGAEFQIGGGPYTVPITIENTARMSTLSLTVTFDPKALRVRSVQEGSFMRQGGAKATFAQQVDAAGGRIDLTFTRSSDPLGASGSGLLAAVVFDAVAPAGVTFAVSGVGMGPGGTPVGLQFTATTVVVK